MPGDVYEDVSVGVVLLPKAASPFVQLLVSSMLKKSMKS
jgi:hypothetical protein